MKVSHLLPIGALALGYYVAEGAPPALPQGERYVSAQLFGVADLPSHIVIATMPSRSSLLGERSVDEIVVVKADPVNRVRRDYGWDPEREFAKLDAVADSLTVRDYPPGCPIPREIWEAIDALDETSYVKSVIAGAGWVESRWTVNAHHYDNDGGYSHGWLQLHGRWRKSDVDWMKTQPGGWRDASVNLQGFLRTIRDHERYYPQTKGSWKLKLSHYNGGKRGNLSYANKCLAEAKELQKWF